MNCFEFRRLLLADPRARTPEQEAHLAGCAECASLARGMESFEARLHDAMKIPVPEALADRVLLRHKIRAPAARAWALAASLVAALGVGIYFYRAPGGEDGPAVMAIAHVLEDEPQMLKENRGVDPVAMRAAFTRLGLNVPADGTRVLYFDTCPMMGGASKHVILQAPFGRLTLILAPEQSLGPRAVVAYRDRTALVNPVRSGSYIVVAESRQAVKRLEQLLM